MSFAYRWVKCTYKQVMDLSENESRAQRLREAMVMAEKMALGSLFQAVDHED